MLSPRSQCLTELIRDLAQMGLVVLHGYHSYPEEISSDVDVLGPADVLRRLTELVLSDRYRVVQLLQHETSCFYWVFWLQAPGGVSEFLQLDFASDYRRNGRVFYRADELIPHRLMHNGLIPVLPPSLEFGYYIIKKVCKGVLTDEQGRRLTALYREAPDGCKAELARFFSGPDLALIQGAARTGQWASVRHHLRQIRRRLLRRMLIRRPWATLAYYVGEVKRLIRRIVRPTGLVVAFYGLDGSGKSTVVQHVAADILPAFRRVEKHHLRPSLGLTRSRGSGASVTSPHSKPSRGAVMSVAKLGYWFAEYWLGWIGRVFPAKVRSTLVIFDRFYHDVIVDATRYRYGGSRWLARVLGRLIPRPDLSIILDVPAEVAQSRKLEVSLEDARLLRDGYLALAREFNAHVVDASRSLREVVADVEHIILNHMAERTRRRLGAIL